MITDRYIKNAAICLATMCTNNQQRRVHFMVTVASVAVVITDCSFCYQSSF